MRMRNSLGSSDAQAARAVVQLSPSSSGFNVSVTVDTRAR